MSQWGDEPATIYDVSTVKAKKNHKCSACGELIISSNKYTVTSILFDGHWDKIKRCARCEKIYEHLSNLIGKHGDYNDFCDERLNCGHSYQEEWQTEPPEEIAALAFALPNEVQL